MNKNVYSSLFFFLLAIYFTSHSYGLGLGDWGMPGPGYFPFGAGLLFGMISLSVMVSGWRKKTREERRDQSSEKFERHNIVLIIVGMLAYILMLKSVGFILSTFLLVILFIRVIAHQRWLKSVMIAVLITLSFQLLFNVLLNAQMPMGLLKF